MRERIRAQATLINRLYAPWAQRTLTLPRPAPRRRDDAVFSAGILPKVVSENLGHATVAFTMDVYAVVAEELAEAAAVAIAAFVPRKPSAAEPL